MRDGLLASRRFQRWAAGFPSRGRIARRRAHDLFDICAGFVYSQVLFACVQLRLFDILRDGPQTGEALAVRLSLSPAAARRLLAAAASLRLVERRGASRFGLGVLGAAMLGNPGIGAMVEHHALLYADLQDPVALLRGETHATAIGRFWSYAGSDTPDDASAAEVAAYSTLMSVSQAMLADDVVDAYPFARHRCLLDVGGGEGNFLAAVAARAPGLQLDAFRSAGGGGAGGGAVCRSWALRNAPRPSAAIFAAIRCRRGPISPAWFGCCTTTTTGRRWTFCGPFMPPCRPTAPFSSPNPCPTTEAPDPVGDAYFGFYLLAMGSGRPRQPAEIAEMLKMAGFGHIERRPTRQPLLTRLLSARRSAG